MIRRATLHDASAIAHIHVATWRAAYAGIVPAEFLASLSVERRTTSWQQQLADGRTVILVAVNDGIMTGWVSAGPSRDADKKDELEIYAIYVSPEHWRRNMGRQLMVGIEEALPDGPDITLWVLRDNQNAISFYEKMDYRFDGTEKEIQLGAAKLKEVRLKKIRPNNSNSLATGSDKPDRVVQA
jgi:ribosomal protein S18 acetylase RimI-like enzyme